MVVVNAYTLPEDARSRCGQCESSLAAELVDHTGNLAWVGWAASNGGLNVTDFVASTEILKTVVYRHSVQNPAVCGDGNSRPTVLKILGFP